MSKVNDYIFKFDQEIIKLVKNIGFKDFLEILSKFSLSTSYDFEDIALTLNEIKNVLDKITSIIYKPHIKTDVTPIIKRSELISSFNKDSFIDTVKDTKLWKEKGLEFTPEYVHSIENIDTIDNYENKFIVLLIDCIDENFNEIKDSLSFINDSIEENYQTKSTNFTKYGIYQEFDTFKYPYESFFNLYDESITTLRDNISKINRRIKNIKASEFYKNLAKSKLNLGNIIPTNVLIHDELYNYCYRYFKNNILTNEENKLSLNDFLYNYFVVNLIKYLNINKVRSNYRTSLTFKNNLINFGVINFKKEFINFSISHNLNLNGLDIDVTFNEDKENNSKYLILFEYNLIENNYSNLKRIIEQNQNKYSEIILITSNNVIKKFDNVMYFSIYDSFKNKINLFNNLFKSFSFIFKVSSKSYKHKCPVCGEHNIYQINKNYQCLDCKSRYSLFDFNNQKLLWIKSLRRDDQ